MKTNILKNGKIIKFTKEHPDFKGIKFVAKALEKSKTEYRHHVKNILFADGLMVGTNGKQLNTYTPTFKQLNGLYSVIINSPSVIILQRITNGKTALSLYPPYKKSIPAKGDVSLEIRYECRLEFSKAYADISKAMTLNFIDISLFDCITYGYWGVEIVNNNESTSMVILENKQDRLTSAIMACLG